MTTTTTSTIAETIADPHALLNSGEALADEAELRARGIGGTWLRRMRRARRLRYIDRRPDLPPGR